MKPNDLLRSGDGRPSRVIRVYTMQPCAPCDILKQALSDMAREIAESGWIIEKIQVVQGDKKAIGRALKQGVQQFPTLKLVADGVVVKSYVSIKQGWTPLDVADFLRGQLAALSSANLVKVSAHGRTI